MIENEKEYLLWLENNTRVGNNDIVASSPKSYVSYLNSVAKRIESAITPSNLSTEEQLRSISNALQDLAPSANISRCKTAMSHYVDMVKANGLKPIAKHIICPFEQCNIKDLVELAGVDVSDWMSSTDPRYCYEWSFIKDATVVLCIWYELMNELVDSVSQNLNLRATEQRLLQPNQKKRALDMDQAIQFALENNLTVRVIVCAGRSDDVNIPSKTRQRLLDTEPWTVTYYNHDTGQCTLTRGAMAGLFVDQFSLDSLVLVGPQRRDVSGQVFVRNPEVRKQVLLRAQGKCEFCDSPGFVMMDGRIFLETHHVVPLSEGGRDSKENVIALCPNHHREGHYGVDQLEMRRQFQKLLS